MQHLKAAEFLLLQQLLLVVKVLKDLFYQSPENRAATVRERYGAQSCDVAPQTRPNGRGSVFEVIDAHRSNHQKTEPRPSGSVKEFNSATLHRKHSLTVVAQFSNLLMHTVQITRKPSRDRQGALRSSVL